MPKDAQVFVRPLTNEERQSLEQVYHQTGDTITKTRCHILLLSADGYSVPQIARLVYYSADTIARCIQDFNGSGLEAILHTRGGGRPPKVTPDYSRRLLEAVASDPRDLGCPFSVWTAELLTAYLAEQTGIILDESRVRYYLHAAAYHLRRPVLSVTSSDPEYASKVARLAELQRQARAGLIDLYYEDEVDVALLPGVLRCWCRRGQQRKLVTPRQNQKRYGAGLTNWMTGTFYWALGEHKDNTLFRAVLAQLLQTATGEAAPTPPRKQYVVIDNYRIHFAKPVQAFLAAHPEIELVTLPTYSPKLNPVERLWKHLRRRVTHNHFFGTIEAVLAAVTAFFAELAASPTTVRSVAGLAA
jgi:transposase